MRLLEGQMPQVYFLKDFNLFPDIENRGDLLREFRMHADLISDIKFALDNDYLISVEDSSN